MTTVQVSDLSGFYIFFLVTNYKDYYDSVLQF